ncbi:MAG: aminoacyl-tRNA hydrolase [Patescibacteria group bacterium]|jgi:PTH1 family peptidyl-tRNA hydrolase
MKLIFGLGNPGGKYKKSRHNIGFMILDEIVQKADSHFKVDQKKEVEIAEVEKNKIIKPQTFMNNSGQAVLKVKNFFKAECNNIWVIHDDVDLDFGKVRIQHGGSSAGHKGIQSIIDQIGESFWRIRVGVGKSEKIPTEDWVLKDFEKNEKERLQFILDQTAELVLEYLVKEIKEETLNFYNY